MANEFLPKTEAMNLMPGEIFFGHHRGWIHTLLGSCVAITLWHPKTQLVGMCHYLLSQRSALGEEAKQPEGYYASDVVAYFSLQCRRHQINPKECVVKVFGGSTMFAGHYSKVASINVAQQNVRLGMQLLKEHGFQVSRNDVGGKRYRKVFFDVQNGDVWVQYGRSSAREVAY
ncbi:MULTISPECIES: chemotaxis protein CheD [unclassified Vibrio]|uniref:chemotaxis protein CheD n=1 Tax=unclassified Vibrio TaxID=2614977 RepID=UPI000B8E80BA|nr:MULTISPECIES: chemotaxis protein CheD [unclassified Vibrio]NAW91927.1 chemotaxis protein CheD [Vibrio sp. V24_P1S3T111]NAW98784.1 chemotaxis protein CheD [Vibrio sp. V23_P3S9T160]OXX20987.1 chemotaxis protein CheD [Vibrio sp. V05_P4A8T149]OXX25526.1 chemotaxis protein CheD [Vibrio sp. V06_P1A73T115]OXX29911.1 chemotaxis protein CheD [Vibrio sp. V04_P4A5T148]